MKKIILSLIVFLSFLLSPAISFASLDRDLYYGLTGNASVRELQQYLISKGFLTGSPTGNYFSLTLSAVKKFQTSKGISATGRAGPLTRQAINADLSSSSAPKTTPAPSTGTTNNPPAPAPTPTTTNVPLTGTLDLSQSTTYLSQAATAPKTKFKLADFYLKNNTSEAINLNKIQIDFAVGTNLYAANLYIKNIYIVYGSNTTTSIDVAAHNNYWTINYQLPVGQTTNLSLYADVDSSIPANSIIYSSILVSGASANSKTAVSTNSGDVFAGQAITFGKGSLTANLDSSTPVAKVYSINQRIVAAKFQLVSLGDSYNVFNLKFIVPNSNNTSTVSDAFLSDSSTQASLSGIIKPVYIGSDSVFDFSVNISVPANSTRYITLYYDLGSYIDSRLSGANISPVLTYIRATNGAGQTVDELNDGVSIPDGGLVFNGIYAFKSTPTFSATASQSYASTSSNANLYTFNISANASGDISVKQIMFTVTIGDANEKYPYLSNFKLFKGGVDYTSSVSIGTTVNNNYIDLTGVKSVGIGSNNIVLTFNREETIQAGKTQTYVLKALSNNFTAPTTTISTFIPTDTEISTNGSYLRMMFNNIYGLAKTATDVYVTNYNLLWSDKSAIAYPSHSDINGFSTDDWYNGFGINGLPLVSQTVTAK